MMWQYWQIRGFAAKAAAEGALEEFFRGGTSQIFSEHDPSSSF